MHVSLLIMSAMLRAVYVALVCIALQGLTNNPAGAEAPLGECGGESILHLLTLWPSPENTSQATTAWNRGRNYLPAARLAAQEVNSREDILPGHELELIEVSTDVCEENLPANSLVNVVRYLAPALDSPYNPVGVVGIVCPAVASFVLPIVNNPGFSLVQVSAGPSSPFFIENKSKFSYLFRVLSSSAVYNNALIALMNEFQWKKISIIGDISNSHYVSTVDDFIAQSSRAGIEIIVQGAIFSSIVSQALEQFQENGLRIVYASAMQQEAIDLLCEAYHRDLLWPAYVWIFHDLTIEDFLPTNDCSHEMVVEALEGVFLMHYSVETPRPSTRLVSGQNYSRFHEELSVGLDPAGMFYARALYDSVWAMALALDMSLGAEEKNGCGLGRNVNASSINSKLQNLSFVGALGLINFNDNQEAETKVDIFQVRGGQLVQIGQYDQSTSNVTLQNISLSMVLGDDFPRRYKQVPVPLLVITIIIAILFILVTTIILILFFHYRNSAEIRATSFFLSLVMFAGCYMMFMATILLASRGFATQNSIAGVVVCNCEKWLGQIGLQMIFTALFVRLLRVYRIFFIYRKMGKLWSDKVLVTVAMLFVFGYIILLSVRTAVDPWHLGSRETLSHSAPPHYEVIQLCFSNYALVWAVFLNSYTLVLIVLVLTLAIKTRKIMMNDFKDTKKVNLYLTATAMVLGVCVPIGIILNRTQFQFATHVFFAMVVLLPAAFCQIFLFVPKVWSGMFGGNVKEKRRPSSLMGSLNQCCCAC